MFIGIGGWLALSVAVGIAAQRQFNRDGTGWALLSVLASPLIGVAFLLALGRYTGPATTPRISWNLKPTPVLPPNPLSKLEFIAVSALVSVLTLAVVGVLFLSA